MNYESMSNFEINKAVALIKFEGCIPYFDEGEGKSMVNLEAPLTDDIEFDPCNKPADAWPIIIENKISIVNMRDYLNEYTAMQNLTIYNDTDCSIVVSDRNPLRAAMIVFLMMSEQ